MAAAGANGADAANGRSSLEGASANETATANGAVDWPQDDEETQGETSAQGLKQELERARRERDDFEAQYKGLLGKLTQMRSTLGERLRQDAEDLEAKEAQIESLTSNNETLTSTVDTLKEELVASNAEAEKLTAELAAVRASSSARSSADDSTTRDKIAALERRARDLQDQAERVRLERERWESDCMAERAAKEEAEERLQRAVAAQAEAEARARDLEADVERESQTARELQSVLEEFQASQDSELQRALGDYQTKYDRTAEALEEHKERAKKAEAKLQEYQSAAERCQGLEREVKEKNLLIGKLRHEAVILNEHLTEALRRLRSEGSDATVDRRLVTNLLLQFLTTPRADAKRFEMLSLIASVLSWNDDERETAGLLTRGAGDANGADARGAAGRRVVGIGVEASGKKAAQPSRGHGRSGKPLDGSAGGEESFSNLFVEFLLSEADKAKTPQTEQAPGGPRPTSPAASSPRASLGSPSMGSPAAEKRSAFNLDALANLRRGSKDAPASPDESAKGKEKAAG